MEGWLKFHRKIFENGLWKNPFDLRVFLWLVGNAVHTEAGVRYGDIKIGRGQILRSYRKLQQDLEYVENRQIKTPSLSTIKRSIERLVSSQRIVECGTELGTLFTIINYEKYQQNDSKNKTFEGGSDSEETELGTELGTLAEQQRNNNKNDKTEKELINTEFGKFWNLYDKKVSKKVSIGLWKKLIPDEKERIFETLPAYINSTPDIQFRKNPDRYLRNKCWEDEIILKENGGAHLDDY